MVTNTRDSSNPGRNSLMMSHYSQTSGSSSQLGLPAQTPIWHPHFSLSCCSQFLNLFSNLCLVHLLFPVPRWSSTPILLVLTLSILRFEFKVCSVLPTPGHGVTYTAISQHCSPGTLSKVLIVYISVIMITQSPDGLSFLWSQGLYVFCSLLDFRAQHTT